MSNITRHFLFGISIFALYSNPILLASTLQEELILDLQSATKSKQPPLFTDVQLLEYFDRKENLLEERRKLQISEPIPRSPDDVIIDAAFEKLKVTDQQIRTILAEKTIPQEPENITLEKYVENLSVLLKSRTFPSQDDQHQDDQHAESLIPKKIHLPAVLENLL